MISIPDFFYSLFQSDATMGLSPYDDDFNFRSRMEGNDYILIVTDSTDDFYDPETGEYSPDAPTYEIRVSRIQ